MGDGEGGDRRREAGGEEAVMIHLETFRVAIASLRAHPLRTFLTLLGVIIVWSRGALRTDDGPPASWSEITPNLGWLLGGSVMAAALVNAAPIGVDILANSSQAELVTDRKSTRLNSSHRT